MYKKQCLEYSAPKMLDINIFSVGCTVSKGSFFSCNSSEVLVPLS